MKLRIILTTLLLAFAGSLFAQQRSLTYQGMLLDAAKQPVTGEHSITVKLYDAPSGGKALHDESFTAPVNNGLFNVLVGSQTAMSKSVTFDKQYWLGISVDGGEEMTPRTALTSVPYATHADAASSLVEGATGAVTSLNGASGDLEFKGGRGTLVETEGKTITITSMPIGNQEPQADKVETITGTANQILANGTTGTAQINAVTLTLPQDIHMGATPSFAGISLSAMSSGSNSANIVVSNSGTLAIGTPSSIGLATGTELATEGATRAASDAALQTNIDAEAASRSAGDAALQTNIDGEASSRETIDAGLQADIDNEGATRQAADVILQNNIDAEAAARSAADANHWHVNGGNAAGASSFVGANNNTELRLQVKDGEAINNSLVLNNNWSIQRDTDGDPRGANAVDMQSVRANTYEVASGEYATISGGLNNRAGYYASVGGGDGNYAEFPYSSISGGFGNAAGALAVVGGGEVNNASNYAVVGGGYYNTADGDYATIGGGRNNIASGPIATIGGGYNNSVTSESNYSTIAGGIENSVNGNYAVIAGGYDNTANGYEGAVIGGGFGNTASGDYAVISGGFTNTASGVAAVISAGNLNTASGTLAVIGGGDRNIVAGDFSTIVGGRELTLNATADRSFGFNANNAGGTAEMTISAANTAVLGNANLWLANTDNTAHELRFYEAQSSAGAFPAANTNYSAFKAQSQSADISYTLPATLPINRGAMVTTSTGSLSWGSHGRVVAVAGTSQTINDVAVTGSNTIIVTIEGTITTYAVTARTVGTGFTISTGIGLTTSDMINYQILP